jgi:hypothetical protein
MESPSGRRSFRLGVPDGAGEVPASGSEADFRGQRAGAATDTFLARGFQEAQRLVAGGDTGNGVGNHDDAGGRFGNPDSRARRSSLWAPNVGDDCLDLRAPRALPPADSINASPTMIAGPTVRPCHLRTAASLERRASAETAGSFHSIS